MSEKLHLQRVDFKDNVDTLFRRLRDKCDFADVTLACEDGQQVEAHKVILAASSPFFRDILKRNKHPHLLIYMRGVKSEDLLSVLDFLYLGEANVLQENLYSFLALGEELQLKDLTGPDNSGKAKEPTAGVEQSFKNSPTMKSENAKQSQKASRLQLQTPTNSDIVVAEESSSKINGNLQDLDAQIKSMMTMTDVKTADGQKFLASCNMCGKQSTSNNMPGHIEANHIIGVYHSCNICGKTSRSRGALRVHKHAYHKTMLQD